MSLQVLNDSVRSHLRSGVAITSLVQCVEELLMNSIDASGFCIAVQVDIPHLMIQVTDNGDGITCEDLKVIGTRYATSKCHTLLDLNHLSCYGYRGEALASLIDICGFLEIVTRHRLSSKTYYKAIHYGNVLPVKENAVHRSSVGTTITLRDIFHSLPVRRKAVCESRDIERVKQAMIGIALIHPDISLSLHNSQSTKNLLQISKTNSLVKRFAQLFGNELSHGLREVSASNMGFSVSGYISLQGHHSKSLQFLYVNGRLVKKTKLHSQINNILTNSLICRKSSAFSNRPSNSLTSPHNCSEKNGIYILTIKCSYNEYDICLEPAKTMVEFKRWDDICSVVEMTVTQFLSDHHLYFGLSICSNMSKKRLASSAVDDNDQTNYGVCSRPAKRVTQTLSSFTGDNSTSINVMTNNVCSQNEPNTGNSFISLNTPMRAPLQCFIKQSDVPGASLCSISSTTSSSLYYRGSPSTLQSKITTRILKQFSSTNKSTAQCTYDQPMMTNCLPMTTASQHCGLSLSKPTDSFITTFADNSIPSNEMMPSKETTNTSNILVNQSDITSTVDNSFISENTTRDIITNVPISDCSMSGDTTNNDDVPDNSMWHTFKDTVTGAPIYVHKATGNTRFTKPIELSQIKNDIDHSYGQCALKSGPHLSCGYNSLLPRPKHMRVHHETSSSSLTEDSLNNEERTVKWRESKEVSSLLSHWSNPAFTGGDNDILNIGSLQNIRVLNVLHSYKFTCDMLTNLKILGQVDNKFIACLLRFETNRSLLVFFDQHAVHERIRLEALTEGAYEYNDNGDKKIKSVSVYPPIILSLSPSERKLARTFSTQLKNIGVQLKHENDHVIVTALPSVIMEKDISGIKRGHPIVTTSLIHELIVKYLESVVRGHCTMPSTIQQILNSQACHGAIKFGDSLCLRECSDLILSLSKCKLPFQCAHGRPSLVPILDLELLEKRFPYHNITNYGRINFSKLKQSI